MTCLTSPAFVPSWHEPDALAVALPPPVTTPETSAAAAHAATRTTTIVARRATFMCASPGRVNEQRRPYDCGAAGGDTAKRLFGNTAATARRTPSARTSPAGWEPTSRGPSLRPS